MPNPPARIDFRRLFTTQRPIASSGEVGHEWAYESDRGRIINSAAVRRLQQKTQVFPLERNAAVRSRLTHSLEVQQTGRFITRQIFKILGSDAEQYGLTGLERAMESLVEMACLMHDIGNPPFGHFGEAAISDWFADFLPSVKLLANQKTPQRKAFCAAIQTELGQFEGNAQGIRLIASLQKLNLTYTQAACVLKYTRLATQPKPNRADPCSYLQKKPGYFLTEATYVAALQQALALQPGHRFALAYVMEAADDISYCLADLEDAVDKGLLTYAALADLLNNEFQQQCQQGYNNAYFFGKSFAQLFAEALDKAEREPINKAHEFFVYVRVALIHPLVQHAAQSFINEIEAVYEGRLNRALLEDGSPFHAVIKTLKNVALRHVFSSPEVETLELQGYRILTGLLNHYSPLLTLSKNEFEQLLNGDAKGMLVQSRLLNRLPNKHVNAYVEGVKHSHEYPDLWEFYCRCRLLQDMVSGMTDTFALEEFRTLEAML